MRGSAVLVHGGWSSPSDWRWVVEHLGAADVEVRAVDLPSHRSSSATRADDVVEVEKTIAEMSPPVVVVGWSYGGAVITDIASDAESVVRLVYVASIPQTPDGAMSEGDAGGTGFDVSVLVFPDDRSCVLNEQQWIDGFGSTFPTHVVEHLQECPRRPVAIEALLAPQTHFAWQSIPVTILLGHGDDLHPETRQAWAADKFADVRIIDGDHFIPFRQPQLIADIVVEALDAASPGAGVAP